MPRCRETSKHEVDFEEADRTHESRPARCDRMEVKAAGQASKQARREAGPSEVAVARAKPTTSVSLLIPASYASIETSKFTKMPKIRYLAILRARVGAQR
eukprot:scaffold407_cov251-Pinguiococcus_pyrenoidosus.AAC.44